MKKSRLRKIIPVIMSAALALNPVGGFWANGSVAEAAEANEIVTEVKPEDTGYFWHGEITIDETSHQPSMNTTSTNIDGACLSGWGWAPIFPVDVSNMVKPTLKLTYTGSVNCKIHQKYNFDEQKEIPDSFEEVYYLENNIKDLSDNAFADDDKQLIIQVNCNATDIYVYDAANYVNSVTNNNENITIASGEETEIIVGSYSSIGNPANIPIEISKPEDFSSVVLTSLIAENGTIKAKIETSQVAFDETVTLSAKIAGTKFDINVLAKASPSFTFPEPPSEKTIINFEAKDSGYFWHGNIKELNDNKIKLETKETNINDIQTTDWQIFFPIDVSGMQQPTIQVNGTNNTGFCKVHETLENDNNSTVIWNYYTTEGGKEDLTSLAKNDEDKKLFIEYKEINDNLSLYVYDAANQLQSVTNNNTLVNVESGKTSSFEVGTYDYIGSVDIPIKVKPTGPVKNASLNAENGKLTLSVTADNVSADTRVNLPAKIADADFTIYLNIKASSGSGEPSGPDNTDTNLVEIQTSANTDTKKRALLVPETTADKDYNKAVVSLECAADTQFNEYCNLVIVATINGEEKTFTQKGIGEWEEGWSGSYEITEADGLSIKKDDIYKIEAYTDSWEEHTSSYVYKAGIELSYDATEEKPPVDTDTGKIYCSTEDNLKLAVIMANSVALKDFDSLKIQIQCASDTSFNPWTSINFIVSVNGKKYEKEIKGDDETYTNGALRNCVLDGFTVKKDDTISINAYTYSWNDAADYVFKLSIEDVDSLVKLSDKPVTTNTPRPIIAYNPGITVSSAPAETKAPEATLVPSSTPATPVPSSAPTLVPTLIPVGTTNAPVTSTEAPAIPDNTKTPEASPSDKPGQTDVDNTSGNGKENIKNINSDGVKYTVTNNNKNTVEYTHKAQNTANVKVPASIKVKVDGKTVTYKVTSIAANAFKNNTKLKTVTISKNIVKIGNNAFKGCKNLKTIKINSKKLTSKNVAKKAFKGIGDKKKVVIKVPKSKYKDYKKLLTKKGLGKKAVIKKY